MQSLQRRGTMRSARPDAFRLISKPCSTSENLLRQKAHVEAALYNARWPDGLIGTSKPYLDAI
jgi:hypothetical protein